MNRHIRYEIERVKNKPNTTLNRDKPCPFCDYETIKKTNRVLLQEDDRLWIENKFPAFPSTYQTVFIESKHCHQNVSNYSKESLYAILSFGFKQWFTLSKDPSFQSVIFFKNHGLESSASIQHPHMQLIGLKEVDVRLSFEEADVGGAIIDEEESFQWNISTKPKNELYEFNLFIDKKEIEASFGKEKTKAFQRFCESIQHTTHFLLTSLCAESQSFNVVFYEFGEKVVAKIIPRNPGNGARLTALFLGYGLSLTPSNVDEIKNDIKKRYLRSEA